MNEIVIYKGETKVLPVTIRGRDVSRTVFVSEIRSEESSMSELIATWEIRLKTDGKDGGLVLVLEDSITSSIKSSRGFMSLKRVRDGKRFDVFKELIEVIFKEPLAA